MPPAARGPTCARWCGACRDHAAVPRGRRCGDLERESLRQKRLQALERSAGLLCRQGSFIDALDAGLRAIRSEPLRESARRRVIAVHLAEGNQSEALRQYDSYRRLLADELGLRPSVRPSESIRRLVAPLLGQPLDFTSSTEVAVVDDGYRGSSMQPPEERDDHGHEYD